MSGYIVHELLTLGICVLSWFGLSGANFIYCRQHGAVDCSGIVEETSGDGLNSFYFLFRKVFGLVIICHLLLAFLAVLYWHMFMRRVLRLNFRHM